MKPIVRTTALLVSLSCISMAALAEDGPVVTVAGFGTGALTVTDTDQAEFAKPGQSSGVKKDVRSGVDSLLGLQVSAQMNNWLSLVGQGIARKNVFDKYGAELTWAFAQAKVSEDFNIRLGRVALPIYMTSEYRNVGYASTMIRPPNEVYGQGKIDSFDGVAVLYQHSFGELTASGQIGCGKFKYDASSSVQVDVRQICPVSVALEQGPYRVYLAYTRADKFTMKSPDLDGLKAVLTGAGFGTDANSLGLVDQSAAFKTIGFAYDQGDFLVQSEYTLLKTSTRLFPPNTSWYVMGAYRFGKLTPFIAHATTKQDDTPGSAVMPAAFPLTPVFRSITHSATQTSNSIGLRWDFGKFATLKGQIDRISPHDGPGQFVNVKPGFTGPVNVYAVGIDFIF